MPPSTRPAPAPSHDALRTAFTRLSGTDKASDAGLPTPIPTTLPRSVQALTSPAPHLAREADKGAEACLMLVDNQELELLAAALASSRGHLDECVP